MSGCTVSVTLYIYFGHRDSLLLRKVPRPLPTLGTLVESSRRCVRRERLTFVGDLFRKEKT